MPRTDTIDRLPKELACRKSEGIEVRLLWRKADDRVFVAVEDSRSGEAFELAVESSNALDAFHHPYAYAARHGGPV